MLIVNRAHIINIYEPKTEIQVHASKTGKTSRKGGKSTIAVKNFNTVLSVVEKIIRKKITKNKEYT